MKIKITSKYYKRISYFAQKHKCFEIFCSNYMENGWFFGVLVEWYLHWYYGEHKATFKTVQICLLLLFYTIIVKYCMSSTLICLGMEFFLSCDRLFLIRFLFGSCWKIVVFVWWKKKNAQKKSNLHQNPPFKSDTIKTQTNILSFKINEHFLRIKNFENYFAFES